MPSDCFVSLLLDELKPRHNFLTPIGYPQKPCLDACNRDGYDGRLKDEKAALNFFNVFYLFHKTIESNGIKIKVGIKKIKDKD